MGLVDNHPIPRHLLFWSNEQFRLLLLILLLNYCILIIITIIIIIIIFYSSRFSTTISIVKRSSFSLLTLSFILSRSNTPWIVYRWLPSDWPTKVFIPFAQVDSNQQQQKKRKKKNQLRIILHRIRLIYGHLSAIA